MKPKNLVLGVFVCTLLVLIPVFVLKYYKDGLFAPAATHKKPTDIIARVGNENIYQKDLDFELSVHPQKNEPKIRQVILNKMVTDSTILQGGEEDRDIVLDASIFNSSTKDYAKRIQAVTSVENSVNTKPDAIEGYVVSIWFRNNGYIGPLGLEKSKQTAYNKIKVLHDAVVANKMTIQQAGDIVIHDTSLKTIDLAYQNNAIFSFTSLRGNKKAITLNKDFDIALWSLEEGKATDIYLTDGIDDETGERYPALYYFGQVIKRSVVGNSDVPFDGWLVGKRKIYAVTYY